jgi:hypothetical protein
VLGLLVVAALTAACGPDAGADRPVAHRSAHLADSTVAPLAAPTADPSVAGVATAAPAATARSVATSPADVATAAPSSAIESDAVPAGQVEVDAVATPSCATAGETVSVAVRTRRAATVGFAATFADAASHGAMGFGEAADDGTFVWRLVVPVDAPAGGATALIGVETAGDRQTGRTVAPFTVAGPGGCR